MTPFMSVFVPGLVLAVFGFSGYVFGSRRGVRAERLRVRYIFVEARNVAMGGVMWILEERICGERDNRWMLEELRKYLNAKEARAKERGL